MARSHTTGGLLWHTFKACFVALFRFSWLVVAWLLKLVGMLCTKVSQLIEKIILKT